NTMKPLMADLAPAGLFLARACRRDHPTDAVGSGARQAAPGLRPACSQFIQMRRLAMGRPSRTSATPALPAFIDQLPDGDENLLSSSPSCHLTTRSASSAAKDDFGNSMFSVLRCSA